MEVGLRTGIHSFFHEFELFCEFGLFSMSSQSFFREFIEFCEILEFGEIRKLQETRGFHNHCWGTGCKLVIGW